MKITRVETGGIDATRRALDAAVKEAARAAIERWHELYLPQHFTEAGFEKYDYQPRKGQGEPSLVYSDRGRAVRQGKYGRLVSNPKYYWRKWRTKHTHDPLVYSGDSKARAQRSIRLDARRSVADGVIRGSGVLDLPTYFYQYRKDQDAPDKADELVRTTAEEEADLASFFAADVQRRLSAASLPVSSEQVA